ncbi:MAG: hypothetical protein U5M50_07750 [Sphingobium sp.]|nr:hypothetical protein [Sphingobium sp.]
MANALNPALGFAAGALTILSPCVLPLVPVVMGSAARASRKGPVVLAAGLVLSFTLTGFLLARLGAAWGLDADIVRSAGAILLAAAGFVLLFQRVQVTGSTVLGRQRHCCWATAREQDGRPITAPCSDSSPDSVRCLVWSGVPAWVRHWALRRCWRRRATICCRLPSR